ncbi:Protein ASP-7 [Aphelenchoides avenae]|nr:Protein ASP-7 [Aphelenchus avenae]
MAIDYGTDPFFTAPSSQKYAIYQLTSQLPKNATTVHINRNPDRSYRLDGTFTIGGIDSQNCDSKWNYVPPSKLYGYVDSSIEVKFSYGKYRDSKPYNAYLTATSAYLTTPPNIIDYIVEATGAEYDFLRDQYTLPCSKDVSKFPDMVFEMVTGFQYHLPASDYIRQLPGNPSNLCTLMLTDGNYQSPQFTLGTTFSRPYCVLFDYDKKQVAFAKNIR